MRAMLVVVLLELEELPLEISRNPEQYPIQTLAPYGPNQPFDDARTGAFDKNTGIELHVRSRKSFSHLR